GGGDLGQRQRGRLRAGEGRRGDTGRLIRRAWSADPAGLTSTIVEVSGWRRPNAHEERRVAMSNVSEQFTVAVTLPGLYGPEVTEGTGVTAAARLAERLGFDSVLAPDLLTGDGTPALESIVAVTAAAAATERIGVGFGVLVPPVRPLPLTAAQIAAVQHLSGGRVRLLGVGAGGFPQSPFWPASGAPAAGRGARLDAAIDALPGLLAGRPTAPGPGLPEVSLAPGVPVPPILVGGGDTEKTLARAARADGWLPSLMPPRRFAAGVRRLTELAGGRPAPHALIGGHVLLGPDSEIAPARDALVRSLVDEHGMDPADAAEAPMAGSPKQVAERLAEYREAGATGVAVSLDGDDWPRLAELFA